MRFQSFQYVSALRSESDVLGPQSHECPEELLLLHSIVPERAEGVGVRGAVVALRLQLMAAIQQELNGLQVLGAGEDPEHGPAGVGALDPLAMPQQDVQDTDFRVCCI